MTNLSTTSSQPWLTRGRLLVGLPLGLGAEGLARRLEVLQVTGVLQ